MHTITFGQTTIPYTINWSNKRKTVGISVLESQVNIIAPPNTPIEKIQEIVLKKAMWIRKQLLHFEEIKKESHQRLFLSVEKLPYLSHLILISSVNVVIIC